MGTSQSAVARLETGQVDVRLSTLERYAAAVDEVLDWHLGGDSGLARGLNVAVPARLRRPGPLLALRPAHRPRPRRADRATRHRRRRPPCSLSTPSVTSTSSCGCRCRSAIVGGGRGAHRRDRRARRARPHRGARYRRRRCRRGPGRRGAAVRRPPRRGCIYVIPTPGVGPTRATSPGPSTPRRALQAEFQRLLAERTGRPVIEIDGGVGRGRLPRRPQRHRPRLRRLPVGLALGLYAGATPGRPMAFISRYSSKPSTPFSRPRPDWR